MFIDPDDERIVAGKIIVKGGKYFELHASGLLIELTQEPEPSEEEWSKGEQT